MSLDDIHLHVVAGGIVLWTWVAWIWFRNLWYSRHLGYVIVAGIMVLLSWFMTLNETVRFFDLAPQELERMRHGTMR